MVMPKRPAKMRRSQSSTLKAPDVAEHFSCSVKTAQRDVHSLADHIGYLSTKIAFLLDATLGMISNEQNNIIKIFSVLAVVLLPPTLVGTIDGMNFQHMPELHWTFGYPMALGLMVIAAVIPWLYFKRKGWL